MNGTPGSQRLESVPIVNPPIGIEGSEKRRNREKQREWAKKHYDTNKEEIKIKSRLYRATHKDKISERNRIYRETHKKERREHYKIYQVLYHDRIRERSRAYYEANKEDVDAYNMQHRKTLEGRTSHKNSEHKRRSLLKQGNISTDELKELIMKSTKCFWCGERFKKTLPKRIDHYKPLARGGEHTLSNIVISCSHCNSSKRATDPYEYANRIGRLL